MQSVQRQFGRMLHKSPGDNAKVAVLLTDVSYHLLRVIAQSVRGSGFEPGLMSYTGQSAVHVSKARISLV